ncbi:MAG TPA: nuclear transport factor 2 family protein [Solirubrobacterales bacterium]|nr:nuclear transport factor 2 family protein [Solirubrobacterales bacterium]
MSRELELVKSIYDDWAEGDFTSAKWADPQIEFIMHGGLNSGRWTGVEEMAGAWAAMLRAWDDLRAIPDEFRELGDGRVLVFLRNEGHGKGSGIDIHGIAAKSANVFTVRDGKVTRLELYWDRTEAMADLGRHRETP